MIGFFKSLFCNHEYELEGRTKMENIDNPRFFYWKKIYICRKCLKKKKVKLI